jgi:hypothetical protein
MRFRIALNKKMKAEDIPEDSRLARQPAGKKYHQIHYPFVQVIFFEMGFVN